MFTVGENFILTGQVGAAGIHEINTGQIIFCGYGLSAKMFFHRQGIITATFNRGVIGHNNAFLSANATYAGNNAGCWNRLSVNLMSGQGGEFQEG